MTHAVTRRAVAKGAAWAVPTTAVATLAPALAVSSPPTNLKCDENNVFPEWSSAQIKPRILQNLVANMANNSYPGGTNIGLGLGGFRLPSNNRVINGINVTGFYMVPGRCDSNTRCNDNVGPTPSFDSAVLTLDGALHLGKVVAMTPIGCSPSAVGLGLATDWTLATTMPYQASMGGANPDRNPGSSPVAISIPVTFIPLNGLTPIEFPNGEQLCCTYLNLEFDHRRGLPRQATNYYFHSEPLTRVKQI